MQITEFLKSQKTKVPIFSSNHIHFQSRSIINFHTFSKFRAGFSYRTALRRHNLYTSDSFIKRPLKSFTL